MNKKYYYYFIFIIIPFYIFGGSIMSYIHNRDNIVNTLEMPMKNHDYKVSDYQKYKRDIEKFDKPIIKDSITVLWLLNIKYTDYTKTKNDLFNLGIEKIYKNYKDKKELLVGPFADKEIAEYMKKKLERNILGNISIKKVAN